MIKPRHILASTLAATLVVAFANLASAEGALEGKEVRASDGAVVGTVAKVITGADGRPAQVLVQPKGVGAGGPRSLPYRALTAQGERFVIPLSKPEFDSMPAVNLTDK